MSEKLPACHGKHAVSTTPASSPYSTASLLPRHQKQKRATNIGANIVLNFFRCNTVKPVYDGNVPLLENCSGPGNTESKPIKLHVALNFVLNAENEREKNS